MDAPAPSCKLTTVEYLERREEPFDNLRLAEYLGWKRVETEKDGVDDIVSGDNYPRLVLTLMREGKILAVRQEWPETTHGPTAILVRPTKMKLEHFIVTEGDKKEEARAITISNNAGSYIMLREEVAPKTQDTSTSSFLAVVWK